MSDPVPDLVHSPGDNIGSPVSPLLKTPLGDGDEVFPDPLLTLVAKKITDMESENDHTPLPAENLETEEGPPKADVGRVLPVNEQTQKEDLDPGIKEVADAKSEPITTQLEEDDQIVPPAQSAAATGPPDIPVASPVALLEAVSIPLTAPPGELHGQATQEEPSKPLNQPNSSRPADDQAPDVSISEELPVAKKRRVGESALDDDQHQLCDLKEGVAAEPAHPLMTIPPELDEEDAAECEKLVGLDEKLPALQMNSFWKYYSYGLPYPLVQIVAKCRYTTSRPVLVHRKDMKDLLHSRATLRAILFKPGCQHLLDREFDIWPWICAHFLSPPVDAAGSPVEERRLDLDCILSRDVVVVDELKTEIAVCSSHRDHLQPWIHWACPALSRTSEYFPISQENRTGAIEAEEREKSDDAAEKWSEDEVTRMLDHIFFRYGVSQILLEIKGTIFVCVRQDPESHLIEVSPPMELPRDCFAARHQLQRSDFLSFSDDHRGYYFQESFSWKKHFDTPPSSEACRNEPSLAVTLDPNGVKRTRKLSPQHAVSDAPFTNHFHHLVPPTKLHLSGKTLTLELEGFVGRGSLSDGYRGSLILSHDIPRAASTATPKIYEALTDSDSDPSYDDVGDAMTRTSVEKTTIPIVAKFIRLDTFRRHHRFSAYPVLKKLHHEAQLYNDFMKDIQGDIVPEFYGLWWGPSGRYARLGAHESDFPLFYLTILQDVGEPIHKRGSLSYLEPDQREHVQQLYKDLHSHGIIHHYRSFKTHHVCVDPKSQKLRLIDFEKSEYVSDRYRFDSEDCDLAHTFLN